MRKLQKDLRKQESCNNDTVRLSLLFLYRRNTMNEKIRGFSGNLTLVDLQNSIRNEEAGGLELFDCIVATDKSNQPINVCKFKLLEPGKIPNDIVFVNHDSPKPASTGSLLFSDVVVIKHQFTTVDFYREA